MNDVNSGNIQIEGLRALERRLFEFPDKLAKNILGGALKEGGKIIQKEARLNVHDSLKPHLLKSYASATFKKFDSKKMGVWITPGNLRKMIRVKVDKTGSRGYKVSYEVYVKNKEAWYWKFVELGTSKMPAQSFIRRAFESEKEFAVGTIKQYILARIEDEGVVK